MQNHQKHWVGDGFHVKTLFSYERLGQTISPFLLLDYAPPSEFSPTEQLRGVGSHPHRGFETVTLAYQGEVTHQDSHGGGGTIKAGDVQWMTAASGLVHEEFHSESFARSGGTFEMVQLWVNLPSHAKMHTPHYQAIEAQQIPHVELDDHGSYVRVIAGQYLDHQGAASTVTPINVWDGVIKANQKSNFFVPVTHNTLLLILSGQTLINGTQEVNQHAIVLFAHDAEPEILIEALGEEDVKFLLLTGEPLHEPIQGYGPFVMNTQQEIVQAFADFNQGKFGEIAAH